MTTTTGTNINSYIAWLEQEVDGKDFGEVTLRFTVCRGQVVKVVKESLDTEQIPLRKKS